MRYFLDCEFDAFGGPLISLALVREDLESLYLVYRDEAEDPWVQENVIPKLWSIPSPMPGMAHNLTGSHQLVRLQPAPAEPIRMPSHEMGARIIASFLEGDDRPYIVADWPDDIAYFCRAVMTGPGHMATMKNLRFEMTRVLSYPTDLPGAVQHNAYWDAKALRHLILPA